MNKSKFETKPNKVVYGGTQAEVEKQLKCDHNWWGPYIDAIGHYYKCRFCCCLLRETDAEVHKKDSLREICGSFVNSVQLDYDYSGGDGIVTLCFRKPRPYNTYLNEKEPVETEFSFPFKSLIIRRINR